MNTIDQVKKLKSMRAELISLIKEADSPQIETILKAADMELHCALWNLGEPMSLRPEMDY
jgi:hypothetical protein